MITKVILTASTPVEVKVRLDSCWPAGEEKGYCYWYWFGSTDSCAGGRVDQPLARLFRLGEVKQVVRRGHEISAQKPRRPVYPVEISPQIQS